MPTCDWSRWQHSDFNQDFGLCKEFLDYDLSEWGDYSDYYNIFLNWIVF